MLGVFFKLLTTLCFNESETLIDAANCVRIFKFVILSIDVFQHYDFKSCPRVELLEAVCSNAAYVSDAQLFWQRPVIKSPCFQRF